MRIYIIFAILFFSFTSAPAFSLRCGSELVRVGHSQSQVLKKCGEPEASFTRTIVRSSAARAVNTEYSKGRTRAFNELAIPIHIEEWEYSFGPRRFGRRVTFENARVVNIELMDYDN